MKVIYIKAKKAQLDAKDKTHIYAKPHFVWPAYQQKVHQMRTEACSLDKKIIEIESRTLVT